jgi:hypothetical protein
MTASSQAPEAKGFRWKLIAPIAVWLVIYLWPVPAGLNVNQWHYFAVFAAVITGLILESMPVGAVGLIGLTVAGVSGYIDPDPTKSLRWMLAGFAESTVWLIVGAFVFSIGYRKSQLWPAHCARAGAKARPQHARPRLCGGDVGFFAGADDAVQYRAQRRYRLSHHQ